MKRFAFVLALAALLVVSAPAQADDLPPVTESLQPPAGQELVPGQCTTNRKFVKLGNPGSSFFGYSNTFCPPYVTISSVPRIHHWFETLATGNWCLAALSCWTSVYAPPGLPNGSYWMSSTLILIAPAGYRWVSGSGLCDGYGSNVLFCNLATPGQNIP